MSKGLMPYTLADAATVIGPAKPMLEQRQRSVVGQLHGRRVLEQPAVVINRDGAAPARLPVRALDDVAARAAARTVHAVTPTYSSAVDLHQLFGEPTHRSEMT